ncbi:Hypothetical protein POVR1_LOCUS31 [uncultured virus]|nr:Hypothetical protein POVR1_LOCUS31 [uncultured virus]
MDLPVLEGLEALGRLPDEVVIEALAQSDYDAIITFCKASKHYSTLCKNPQLWRKKVQADLGPPEDQFIDDDATERTKTLVNVAFELGRIDYLLAMRDLGYFEILLPNRSTYFLISRVSELMDRMNIYESPDREAYNRIFQLVVSEYQDINEFLIALTKVSYSVTRMAVKQFISFDETVWNFIWQELNELPEDDSKASVAAMGWHHSHIRSISMFGFNQFFDSRLKKLEFPMRKQVLNPVTELENSAFGKRKFQNKTDQEFNIALFDSPHDWLLSFLLIGIDSGKHMKLFYARLEFFSKFLTPEEYALVVNLYFQKILKMKNAVTLREFLDNGDHVALLRLTSFQNITDLNILKILIKDGRIDLSINDNIMLRRAKQKGNLAQESLLLTDPRVAAGRRDIDIIKGKRRPFTHKIGTLLPDDDIFYDSLVTFIAEPERREEALANMIRDRRILVIEWTTATGTTHKMFFNDRAQENFHQLIDGLLVTTGTGRGMAEYSVELTTIELKDLNVYELP